MGYLAHIELLLTLLVLTVAPPIYATEWADIAINSTLCAPCACTEEHSEELERSTRMVTCSGLGLNDIPAHLPTDLESLDLSNNNLTDIRNSSANLHRYPLLMDLNLAGNNIIELPANLFQNASLLQSVEFTGNKLQNLSSGIFNGLFLLRKIHGLNVDEIPKGLFHNTARLRELTITTNQTTLASETLFGLSLTRISLTAPMIQSIPALFFCSGTISFREIVIIARSLKFLNSTLFQGLNLLQKVHIEACSLPTLPESIFTRTIDSETLDLALAELPEDLREQWQDMLKAINHYNLIEDITLIGINNLPMNLFDKLERLKRLSLTEIDVIRPEVFEELNNLEYLNLTSSELGSLAGNWFKDLMELETLDISNNDLVMIEDDAFVGLVSLKNLDASNNNLQQIGRFAFKPFSTDIENLDLSDNHLETLQEGLFSHLWSLKVLNLQSNDIVSLPSKIFEDLELLRELHLQDNNLIEIPADLFVGLTDLVSLELQDNDLRTIPKDLLTSSTSLTNLDISNNRISFMPPGLLSAHRLLDSVVMESNPLHCDCGLFYLIESAERSDTALNGVCTSPLVFAGRNVSSLTNSEVCPLGIRPGDYYRRPILENNSEPGLEEVGAADAVAGENASSAESMKVVGVVAACALLVGAALLTKYIRNSVRDRTYTVTDIHEGGNRVEQEEEDVLAPARTSEENQI